MSLSTWSFLLRHHHNRAPAISTYLQESKAKITSDTDQAVNALNGRIASWTSVGLGWGEAGVDQWILCFDI
jgi:hypothetical protein